MVALSSGEDVVRASTCKKRLETLRPLLLGPLWSSGVVESWREVPRAWDIGDWAQAVRRSSPAARASRPPPRA